MYALSNKTVKAIKIIQECLPVTIGTLADADGVLLEKLCKLADMEPEGRDNILRAMDSLDLVVRGSYVRYANQ